MSKSICQFCKWWQYDPGGKDEPPSEWCENGMKQFNFAEGCYMYEEYETDGPLD